MPDIYDNEPIHIDEENLQGEEPKSESLASYLDNAGIIYTTTVNPNADSVEKPVLSPELFTDSRMDSLMYSRKEGNWFNRFSRYGIITPYETLTGTREYIFFTKPNLHLFDNYDDSKLNPELANFPYFEDMHENYRDVLRSLSLDNSASKTITPFMNALTWAVNSSLDLPDIAGDSVTTSATVDGVELNYMWAAGGDNNFEFSLEFEDTKYLDIYNIFKAWGEYSRLKSSGLVTPPDDSYIINQQLHDQIAIYKFIVSDDLETIIHYSKFFGVYPLGVPRSLFGSLDSKSAGNLNISVNFKANFIEDHEPLILSDFNELVSSYGSSSNFSPLFNSVTGLMNGKPVGMPYVVKEFSNTRSAYVYKLKWRE